MPDKPYDFLCGFDDVDIYDKKLLFEVMHEKNEYSDDAYAKALQRLSEGEPLAYLLGEWYFYGETFYINRGCLIPRADTEHVVDKLIKELPENGKFLELCCGSGCISISALIKRQDAYADMFDISESAVKAAKINAEKLGVSDRAEIFTADLFCPDAVFPRLQSGRTVRKTSDMRYDIIVANPPYIRTEVIKTLLEQVRREPEAALDGGDDGLKFYRFIVPNYRMFLSEKGKMIFEIGYDQANDIKEIAEKNGFSCAVFKDYGGNDRVAILLGSF